MFFYDKKREVSITIRDEWGVLHELVQADIERGTPQLTDEELAAALRCCVVTVKTHRRD